MNVVFETGRAFADKFKLVDDALPVLMICGCMLDENSEPGMDEEGHILCPTHNVRRYGYRSRSRHHDHDWMSDIEYERFVLFGIEPQDRALTIKSNTPDLRDNRDPQSLVTIAHSGDFSPKPVVSTRVQAKR